MKVDAAVIRGLMLRLSHLTRHEIARMVSEFGITFAQYTALVALFRRPDGCTMGELAEAVLQVAATTTGIVDRLAERGLVQRRQDPADRRAWRVSLTAAGEQLMAEIELARQAWSERVLAHFVPADRHALRRLLKLYRDAIDDELAADEPAADEPAAEGKPHAR